MKKLSEQAVYKNSAYYCAFPCVERCANGDLLVAFRRAPREESVCHFHSQSRAVVVRSADEGKTWSEPIEIFPDYDLAQQDPSITLLPNGELLAAAFTWQYHPLCEKEQLLDNFMECAEVKGGIMRCAGIVTALSVDNGHTWNFMGKLKPEGAPRRDWACAAEHSKAAVLPGGGILLPLRVEAADGYYTYIVRSDTMGKSWRYVTEVARDTSEEHHHYYNEAFIQRTESGKLMLFMRCYDDGGRMEVCVSEDDGQSWSAPQKTAVWGYPQTTTLLQDGSMLLVYGHRRAPFGVRGRLLNGECANIDTAPEFAVYETQPGALLGECKCIDLGYPSGVELADGRLLVVFYCHDPADDVTHIRSCLLER